MDNLTIVIENDNKTTASPTPPTTTTNSKTQRENLKIQINNMTNQNEEIEEDDDGGDVLDLETDDLQQEDENDEPQQDKRPIQEALVTDKMITDESEIEFHVNLDKKPLTLEAKSLIVEKLYINDSLNEQKPDDEIVNKSLSQENQQEIYESFEINESVFDTKLDDPYRKDALHIYGVNEMSTSQIFDYLNNFRPYAIEWINDFSCNVLWNNDRLAALALYEYTKPFKPIAEVEVVDEKIECETMSVVDAQKSDDAKPDEEPTKEAGEIDDDDDYEDVKSEDSATIANQPPQTHKWRVGIVEAVNGNQIYFRYARRSDKKVPGAESRSKYYQKYGNPNYGFVKGIISSSKREQFKSRFTGRSTHDEHRAGIDSSDSNRTRNQDKEILKRINFTNKRKRDSSESSGSSDNDDNSRRGVTELFTKNSEKTRPKMSMYADEYDRSKKRTRDRTPDKRTKHSSDDLRSRLNRNKSSSHHSGMSAKEKIDLRNKLQKNRTSRY